MLLYRRICIWFRLFGSWKCAHLKRVALLMIILLFRSSSLYSTIIVISAIGADRYLHHLHKIMARAAAVIGGKWTRETNVHSSALSWSTEAHYICIASRVDSAIKPRPLLLTNFRIIYNLTGLLSSMRKTILRKIITIIISMPETLPQLFYLHKKINEWHADRAVIFWNIARMFRALVK